jgi:hypothetical protein
MRHAGAHAAAASQLEDADPNAAIHAALASRLRCRGAPRRRATPTAPRRELAISGVSRGESGAGARRAAAGTELDAPLLELRGCAAATRLLGGDRSLQSGALVETPLQRGLLHKPERGEQSCDNATAMSTSSAGSAAQASGSARLADRATKLIAARLPCRLGSATDGSWRGLPPAERAVALFEPRAIAGLAGGLNRRANYLRAGRWHDRLR